MNLIFKYTPLLLRHYVSFTIPSLSFCTVSTPKSLEQTKRQLFNIVESQLKQQQSKKPDKQRLQKLLFSIGWTVFRTGSRLQLVKQNKTHKFHTFITIKSPIELTEQKKKSLIEQKEMQILIIEEQLKKRKDPNLRKQLNKIKQYLSKNPFNESVYQITVFVNKLNSENSDNQFSNKNKYICLQFIANSQFAQLQDMSIMDKIIQSRLDRFFQCSKYLGRSLPDFNIEIIQIFSTIIEGEWQLRKEVLQTMFQLTVCYEQQEYIKWLKSLSQIV